MRHYELTINTKEAESLLEKVVSYLPHSPVRQQKNSFWLSVEFYADPEKIEELEKKLKADSLRYLLLTKKELKETKPKRRPMKKPVPETAPSLKKKKVELSEIDKKLEELLKEK